MSISKKTKWMPTKTDIENKREVKEMLPTLPPIGPDFIPIMTSFYVDDGAFYGKVAPKGITYDVEEDSLIMSSEQSEIDKDMPGDQRMINLIIKIGNTIDKDIQLTGDAPSLNKNGYMPLLDTQVTIKKSEEYPQGQILFRHYRKSMASKLTLQRDSALPLKQQITIMSQEVLRIMRNSHPDSGEYWKEDISDFAQRMFNSGWDQAMRVRVIKSGITGWFKILGKEINEKIPRYRHRNFMREERDRAKADKKQEWFKSPNLSPEEQPDAVLMVEATPNSEVKHIFEKAIKQSKLKISVREIPGPKYQYQLMATNKTTRMKCPPDTCLMCETKNGGYCRSKEIVYEIKCAECKMKYIGQTGRNAMTRQKEHVDKSKSLDPKIQEQSFMFKHVTENHANNEVKWEMKTKSKHPKNPLNRLVSESWDIANTEIGMSLNSKVEMAKSSLIKPTFISENKKEILDKILISKAIQNNKNKNPKQTSNTEIVDLQPITNANHSENNVTKLRKIFEHIDNTNKTDITKYFNKQPWPNKQNQN